MNRLSHRISRLEKGADDEVFDVSETFGEVRTMTRREIHELLAEAERVAREASMLRG
jgi:hypothetical protein